MGMTLPLIVAAYAGPKGRFAMDAGVVYGVNTLGAVAGTLAAAFVLVPTLGIVRTCVVVGVVDVLVGGVALALDRRLTPPREAEEPAAVEARAVERWSPRQAAVGAVYAASGALAMVAEVAWFRLLGLTMGPTVYAFAAMLATFLLGVAIGSAAAARWAERTRLEGVLAMGALEALLGAVVLGGLYYYNALPALHWEVFRRVTALLGGTGFVVAQLAVAAVVLLVPCLVLGALFPVAVRGLEDAGPPTSAATHVGRLYLANTAGGIAGTLAAGFWLVPTLGTWTTLRAAGVGSIVLGATLCLVARSCHPALRAGGGAAALALAAALAVAAPPCDVALFNQGLYREVYVRARFDVAGARAERLVYQHEGVNAPVAVFAAQGRANLRVSGKADASTSAHDLQTQLFVGQLPMLFAPAPRRAAVIGYGSGMSAAAMLAHPELQTLDVVEIEQAVIDASPYFASVNDDPFDDPRTRLVLEDGRTYLTHTARSYDVITSEPSNPWMAGIANLFTVDFYRAVRARLAHDGVFGQWVQLYEVGPETFATIVATIAEVFPHVVVFGADAPDAMVLASPRPIRLPYREFADRFAHDAVRASFARVGMRAPLDVAYYVRLSESQTAALAASTPTRNTDDNVWLEHRMVMDLVRRAASSASPVDAASGDAQNATVESMLVDLAAAGRVQTIEELLPGVRRDEVVDELAAYGSTVAPEIVLPGTVVDHTRATRERLMAGLRAELESLGEPALRPAAERAYAESERRRADRIVALQTALDVVRGVRPPSREVVEAALARAPDLPLAHVLIGNLALGAHDVAAAELAYRRALNDPSDNSYYYALVGLGNVASQRGDLETAVRRYEDAIAWNPYIATAFRKLALAYDVRADHANARETLERGLRFNPGDPDLTRTLASPTS
jgi:spermidine synthase